MAPHFVQIITLDYLRCPTRCNSMWLGLESVNVTQKFVDYHFNSLRVSVWWSTDWLFYLFTDITKGPVGIF